MDHNSNFHNITLNITNSSTTDQPDAYMSHLLHIKDQIRFIDTVLLMPVMVTCGVLGNAVSIYVLRHRTMRTSINNYLTAIAIADLLYLIFAFSLTLHHMDADLEYDVYYTAYQYLIGVPFTNLWSNIGVWLIVAFTVERYIAVCQPLRERRSSSATKYVVLTIVLVNALVAIPSFFEYQLDSSGEFGISETKLKHNKVYSAGYIWLCQILFTIVPMATLFIMNCLIWKELRNANMVRRQLSATTSMQPLKRSPSLENSKKTTVMLCVIVIVFMICHLPQACLHLYYIIMTSLDLADQYTVMKIIIVSNMFNLLVMINASVNFIIYSVLSVKFRFVFRKILNELKEHVLDCLIPCRIRMNYHGHDSDETRSNPIEIPLRRLSERNETSHKNVIRTLQ